MRTRTPLGDRKKLRYRNFGVPHLADPPGCSSVTVGAGIRRVWIDVADPDRSSWRQTQLNTVISIAGSSTAWTACPTPLGSPLSASSEAATAQKWRRHASGGADPRFATRDGRAGRHYGITITTCVPADPAESVHWLRDVNWWRDHATEIG